MLSEMPGTVSTAAVAPDERAVKMPPTEVRWEAGINEGRWHPLRNDLSRPVGEDGGVHGRHDAADTRTYGTRQTASNANFSDP